ncbi:MULTISPECIES: hypothetical protein [unclassified Frondihabitans]|uniref:hypothetical protein n=1 Tax=unclassified Frondihabitans TaxID=2626248 RepID=UPI000F505DE8|nr:MULTISPECIES: hypothetical protein [unclassified Frondihabitans]RPE73820.1 hypothetical protein EDF37_3368 [Frondihabitans sp. PhB153]RPF04073.1 hypothetical protein EDF39_2492 [Frondihabitans sp. PhB161]
MSNNRVPRTLTAVLVEETDEDIVVTWGLGEPAEGSFQFFGYGLAYYGRDGNGGKRFGVRLSDTQEVTAFIFDHASATQANYTEDGVMLREDAIVVRYRDASIGLDDIGIINAYSHTNGRDRQVDVPVTLMGR